MLQGLALLSTEMSEIIGQWRCCLHWAVCRKSYFKPDVGAFFNCWGKHEYVLVLHSDGGTEVEDLSLHPHPRYLVFSTSSSLFSLAGMQIKGLLQDDGAPLWQLSRPHIWTAAAAVLPSARFRVCLKVCRCVSPNRNDRLPPREWLMAQRHLWRHRAADLSAVSHHSSCQCR